MTQSKQGFTLLEILLVVALISVLAGIVIIAINPSRQLADTRNAQRQQDVNTILNAVYQYAIGENGIVPSAIPTSSTCATPSTNEICATGSVSCAGLVDLGVLSATSTNYVVGIPNDPTGSSATGTGYFIAKDPDTARVTVCAPSAELGVTISVVR